MRYVELTAADDNFIEGDRYIVRVDEENATFRRQLEQLGTTIAQLRDAIRNGDFSDIPLAAFAVEFKPLFVREHLYHPLIYAKDVEVSLRVSSHESVEMDFSFSYASRC